MARLSAGGACLLENDSKDRVHSSAGKASSGAWVSLPPRPQSSSMLLLLYFLLTYQTEIGLPYKNLPENIMYERHSPRVFMF